MVPQYRHGGDQVLYFLHCSFMFWEPMPYRILVQQFLQQLSNLRQVWHEFGKVVHKADEMLERLYVHWV